MGWQHPQFLENSAEKFLLTENAAPSQYREFLTIQEPLRSN